VKRIHWAYADKAVASYDGRRFYLAVPLDGATYNIAVLVYSTVSGTWQGYWESEILDAGWMLKAEYAGGRRVMVVNRANLADWHAQGAVLVLDEGFTDELGGTEYPIEDTLVTRAFALGSNVQVGRMLKLAIAQSTWAPSFTVSVLAPGAFEETVVAAGVTKSRTRYYRFGLPDWTATNENDDHDTPGREDYSVLVEGLVLGSGVECDRHQRAVEQFRVRAAGQTMQVKVVNAAGRALQHGVRVESVEEASGYRRR
jgi:hypothetical protein